ncbi:MAG: hypothetical protein ACXAC5_00855 [Promethearchaeota archaeon]|jgi:hypothetical protein
MKLSIFIPGIRTENWMNVYNSVSGATSMSDYELIFIGPYRLPSKMRGIENIRFIQDYGSPTRCNQLGLIHSKGEYVLWGADDGAFVSNMAIDKAFACIPKHDKGVVALPFFEGRKEQYSESWWKIGYHKLPRSCPYVPNDHFVIMEGLIKRKYLMEIGGWDCRFEHTGLGTLDMGIRLQNDGAEVVLGEILRSYPLVPKKSGPIRAAHHQDKGLFHTIYGDVSAQKRIQIDIDNWQQAPSIWSKRFKRRKGRIVSK